MDQLQQYIHTSKYARWVEHEGRREDWAETVERYIVFMVQRAHELGYTLSQDEVNELYRAIFDMEVMPSMRALMTAGPALRRDHVAAYNCAFTPVESLRDFDEIMDILMCGTGMGFSVESKYVSKLPVVPEHFHPTDTTIVVADSRIGWAKAFRELLSLVWENGLVPNVDYSRLRPKGARLKTFGGRSSGPEPLRDLFSFTISVLRNAAGRKLRPIEVHDIVCKIADIVVVGGVRRSALISLSDVNDQQMRVCKSGNWWETAGHRRLANNSAAYTGRPDLATFMDEWKALYESHSGERGIYNRDAARRVAERTARRNAEFDFGCNPCSEIILRPRQFCNLTEVVVRAGDSLDDLCRKVRLATVLGTLQSTLTDFRYLRKEWKNNCEEERLLGVSLTGIMDHEILSGRHYGWSGELSIEEYLAEMRREAVETNRLWASRLGIAASASITCVKPSGTVSQLVNSSSGIHPRHSAYYIRRVRQDKMDKLSDFMKAVGVPCEDDVMSPNTTYVFSFPVKAPQGSVKRTELSAIQQLEVWKTYAVYWCEHKPSATIYVKPDEWMDVAAWVWRNFDIISGVSFLPYSDSYYPQLPYEDIDEATYNRMVEEFPEIDWALLTQYEQEDTTTGSQELACTGGACEI